MTSYRGLMRFLRFGGSLLWASVLVLSFTAGAARADVPRRPPPTTTTTPPSHDDAAPRPVAPDTTTPPTTVTGSVTAEATATYAAPDSIYVAPPVPDDEAVIVSFTTATTFTSPLVTITDHTGAEMDCVLPCTVRTRAGHVSLHAPRLSVGVDLDPAGLTYDVALAEGPSGDDVAAAVALTLSGGLVLGLAIWAFVTPDLDDGILALAAIGAAYGGIAFIVGFPFMIATLATLGGSASLTGFRVGLSARVQLTGSGMRVDF